MYGFGNYEGLFDQFRDELGPEFYTFVTVYIAVLAVVLVIACVFALAVYVMDSLAVMKMGQKIGVKRPWLSWIPIANSFAFGKIAETPEKPRKTGKVLLILAICECVCGLLLALCGVVMIAAAIGAVSADSAPGIAFWIPMALIIVLYIAVIGLAIAYAVIYYMAFYRICKLFGGSQYLTYFLLGFIPVFLGLGISMPIAMLVLSSKQPDPRNMYPKTPDQIWHNPLPGENGGNAGF